MEVCARVKLPSIVSLCYQSHMFMQLYTGRLEMAYPSLLLQAEC